MLSVACAAVVRVHAASVATAVAAAPADPFEAGVNVRSYMLTHIARRYPFNNPMAAFFCGTGYGDGPFGGTVEEQVSK